MNLRRELEHFLVGSVIVEWRRQPSSGSVPMIFDTSGPHQDIRGEIAKLCRNFQGEYWRKLDRERAYPQEFVEALTKAGYLSILIPEDYGGAGSTLSAAAAILEEIHFQGCNGAACHAQMYMMGTLLRHGSEEQKRKYLPAVATGELRLQAFGVSEPMSGTDTAAIRTSAKREGDQYIVNGQKIWTSRAEHSDLMPARARSRNRRSAARGFPCSCWICARQTRRG
jgi:acyl-CoA dehydrogenase